MKKTILLLIFSLHQAYYAKERVHTAAWQMNTPTETDSEALHRQTSPYEYTPDDYYIHEADTESDFDFDLSADFSPDESPALLQLAPAYRIPLPPLGWLLHVRHNPER